MLLSFKTRIAIFNIHDVLLRTNILCSNMFFPYTKNSSNKTSRSNRCDCTENVVYFRKAYSPQTFANSIERMKLVLLYIF